MNGVMRKILRTLGKLGLVSLLAASGPCNGDTAGSPGPEPRSEKPPAVPSAAPANNPPSTGTIALSNNPYAPVLATVDAIAALPDLNKAALERIFGVTLAHAAAALPTQQYFEASLPSGPFSRVEVRESTANQRKLQLVMLDVRQKPELSLANLRAAGRIQPNTPVQVYPNVPPEGIMSYLVRSANQAVRYSFTATSELLSGVAIERPPS